jgi:peroxisomal 3,2-trans-enoyl-CoA isomerase
MSETLSYQISGSVFEIHINNPNALNSFTIPEFVQLAQLFDMADKEESTSVTLITSSGDFFSTGANIKFISKMVDKTKLDYYEQITSKNILLVHTILNHHKLIVVALNGPVIGLSAALVCLMDVIYARNPIGKTGISPYMQFPFATIGLVNECGVSASLPYRLGITTSLEAVCLARRITLDEMVNCGFISQIFETESVDSFNELVKFKINEMTKNLAIDSIIENKKLIKSAFNHQVDQQIVNESMAGLSRWVDERPQSAFKAMVLKNKHSKGKL